VRSLVTILLAVTLVGCTTHIPIRTEIVIDAPIERVFSVLIDFENYPKWNPYHVSVTGRPEVGAELSVTVRRPDGKVIEVPAVHVLRLRKNQELTWGGGIKGIFYGEHVLELKKVGENKTRLIHNEDFEGLFIGFADLPPDVLTKGYTMMNEALKSYVEGT
jgi:hypothetical protein